MYRIYFDTNIFEDIVKKVIDISADELNSFTNVAYYISTAHVEEYFIAIKNDLENKYTQSNHDRKALMSSLNLKGILNPSNTRIKNKPEKFDDASSIANHLNQKRTVVLNLESTNKEISKRLVDFLTGVAYANKANINRVATNTFIITPQNVDLMGGDILGDMENNGSFF